MSHLFLEWVAAFLEKRPSVHTDITVTITDRHRTPISRVIRHILANLSRR